MEGPLAPSSLLPRRLEGVRTCNVFFQRTCNAPGVMGGGATCDEFFQTICNAPGVHLVEGTFGTLQFAVKRTAGGRTCNPFCQRTCNAPGVMGAGTTCNAFFQRTCNAPGVHLLEGTFGTLQFALKKVGGG